MRTAKPMENMFICGAARVMKASAIDVRNSTAPMGAANSNPHSWADASAVVIGPAADNPDQPPMGMRKNVLCRAARNK